MVRVGKGVGTRAPLSAAATGYLLLALPVLFWGGSYRSVAIAGPHTSTLMLIALRGAISAVIVVALLPLLRSRFPTGRLLVWAAITGVLGVVVYYEGFSEAVLRAGAGNAAVLSNTSPFFVLLLGRAFLGERMSLAGMLGLVVGFAGVVMMVSSQLGGSHGSDLAVGMALALAAGAAWGISTLMVKWLAERDPGLDVTSLTAGQFVVGGVILGVLALAVDGTGGTDWSSSDLWGPLLFMAIGGSVIAVIAFFAALKRLPATIVSSTQFLVPVVAVIIEMVLGHIPSGLVLAGMLITIAGVALVNLSPALRLPWQRSLRV